MLFDRDRPKIGDGEARRTGGRDGAFPKQIAAYLNLRHHTAIRTGVGLREVVESHEDVAQTLAADYPDNTMERICGNF